MDLLLEGGGTYSRDFAIWLRRRHAMILADSNIFPLEGTGGRWLHLATIHHSLREFMHFYDMWTGQGYIEELTGGDLTFIEDDALYTELEEFLAKEGVHYCQRVNLSDSIWRQHPLNRKYFPLSCPVTIKKLVNS
jgi:hypothetical protein